jgi:hypothetical protein
VRATQKNACPTPARNPIDVASAISVVETAYMPSGNTALQYSGS